MPVPTTHLMSHHFTNLIGRQATFTPASAAADASTSFAYGVYMCFPAETPVVLKAGLSLLGSFAGALVGLPDSEVESRLKDAELGDILRDAIYEVLNVAASVVALEGRATLIKMVTDPSEIDGAAKQTLEKPTRKIAFDVSVADYQGGRITLLY
jgi:hypothetical protein